MVNLPSQCWKLACASMGTNKQEHQFTSQYAIRHITLKYTIDYSTLVDTVNYSKTYVPHGSGVPLSWAGKLYCILKNKYTLLHMIILHRKNPHTITI